MFIVQQYKNGKWIDTVKKYRSFMRARGDAWEMAKTKPAVRDESRRIIVSPSKTASRVIIRTEVVMENFR